MRKRYELELKEQMEAKKKIDDEVREFGVRESRDNDDNKFTEKEEGEGGGGEV